MTNTFSQRPLPTDPGYTPGPHDISLAFEVACGDKKGEAGQNAIRVLARIDPIHLPRVAACAERFGVDGRRLACRVMRHALPHSDVAARYLLSALLDESARVRAEAASQLGRARFLDSESALLSLLTTESDASVLRAVAQALAKFGTPAASRAAVLHLSETPGGTDVRAERARIVAIRNLERGASRFELSRLPREAVLLDLACYPGLSSVLAMHPALAGSRTQRASVRAHWSRPLSDLFGVRMWTEVSMPLGDFAHPGQGREAELVRTIVDGKRVRELVPLWAELPATFRLAWSGRTVSRALAFAVAELVGAHGVLRNDPIQSMFELRLRDEEGGRFVSASLAFTGIEDPRFVYRTDAVPAASHPTIAAALAFLASPRPGDRVWDPFVGGGTELVEVSRLCTRVSLAGTDSSTEAIELAAQTCRAAGVDAELSVAGVQQVSMRGMSLIVTNPPYGRRTDRGTQESDPLATLIRLLPSALVRGGRMVWITPAPKVTNPLLAQAGFRVARAFRVDLHGLTAEVQRVEHART